MLGLIDSTEVQDTILPVTCPGKIVGVLLGSMVMVNLTGIPLQPDPGLTKLLMDAGFDPAGMVVVTVFEAASITVISPESLLIT